MIASVHIADIGARRAPGFLRRGLDPRRVPGLRWGGCMITAPLGGSLPPPAPRPGRVGLVAFWEEETALDRFLADHPLAERLAGGWHARLEPVHVFGGWSELPDLVDGARPMEPDEPVAVITLGKLRLTHTVRFLRANAPAAGLAVANPELLAATALARPPRIVSTFSLWRTTAAMRDYASGRAGAGHRAAVEAQKRRSFHHESLFARFRPYASSGTWDGSDPLASAWRS